MGFKEVRAFVDAVQGGCFYCFDTETTGLSPVDNDIIEFSAIRYAVKDGFVKREDALDVFIDPGYPIPEEITALTGITNDKIASCGVKPMEAAKRIRDFWGERPFLIGYNSVSFDEGFVKSLYGKTIGESFTPALHLDVLKMAREKLPKPHKLCAVADYFGISEDVAFHTSIADADVTFKVFSKLLPMYKADSEAPAKAFSITRIQRWKKGTLDRIYVNNAANAAVYLDVIKSEWTVGGGYDEADIVPAILEYAGATDLSDFVAKYPG